MPVAVPLIAAGISAAGSVAGGMMGKSAAKSAAKSSERAAQGQFALANYDTGRAASYIDNAATRRTTSEEESRVTQNALGTGAAGREKIAYLQPYALQYNPVDYLSTYGGGSIQFSGKDRRKPGEIMAYQRAQEDVNTKTRDVNNAYAEALRLGNLAYEAKLAGNTELEAQYKAQADATISNAEYSHDAFSRFTGGKYGSRDVNLSDQRPNDSYGRISDLLESPMGQTVDAIVGKGRALMDRNSEEYKTTQSNLTGPVQDVADTTVRRGTMALAGERRRAESEMGTLAASRGAGRSVFAERNAIVNLNATFAQKRVDLMLAAQEQVSTNQAQVAQFMELYSSQYAASSVDIGRAFAEGSPFIREIYQSAMDSLNMAAANLFSQSATQARELGAMYQNASYNSQARANESGQSAIGGLSGAMSSLANYSFGGSKTATPNPIYNNGLGQPSGWNAPTTGITARPLL